MATSTGNGIDATRLFGSLVESRRQKTSRLHVLTLQIALAVHALALGVVLVRSWLEIPPIDAPSVKVDFATVTPPPPPPPAPPKPAAPTPAPKQETPPPTGMVEPVEMPDIIVTERIPDPEPSSGVVGGVEGGVEGGVLGGVPGGVLDSGPFRIGGPATLPVLVHKVQPAYPPLAMNARVQGVVKLEALIRKDGSIADIRPLKKLSMGLTEAAIEAVRQWRYKPGELNGIPVDFYLEVEVLFRL
jgi:protein TonB